MDDVRGGGLQGGVGVPKTVMLKWGDGESKKGRRRGEMTAGRTEDGRRKEGQTCSMSWHEDKPPYPASGGITSSCRAVKRCISSSKGGKRLSAPFAEDNVRQRLSADMRCRQSRRATNDSDEHKSKMRVGEHSTRHPGLIVIHQSTSCSLFLINFKDLDEPLLPFSCFFSSKMRGDAKSCFLSLTLILQPQWFTSDSDMNQ